MTPQEMAERLRRRGPLDLPLETTIGYCFAVMKEHSGLSEQCLAAIILSGIVQKGLGQRTLKFLKENSKLPPRVQEILGANILRMEGY